MSEKFTEISASTEGGFTVGNWGHLSYEESVAWIKSFAEGQLEQAQRTLAAVKAGKVRVYHQRGVHVARDRKEITSGEDLLQREGLRDGR